MKTIKPILLALASAFLILTQSPAKADKVKDFVIQDVSVSGGVPSYAGLSRGFIPTDGTDVAIVLERDPDFVRLERANFNLLDGFDIPGAWEAPLLYKGNEWFYAPWDGMTPPFQFVYQNDGPMPVYFVELEELELAMADDVLTIGELEALSSLRVGYTRHLRSDVRNANHPQAHGTGRSWTTAMGEMEEGGGFFFHWKEEFNPETGINTIQNIVIKFPGSVPASAPVPEPNGLALLLVGGTVVAFRRRFARSL